MSNCEQDRFIMGCLGFDQVFAAGNLKDDGCVWFEDKSGWDIAIHGYKDMDIHVVCLVGWMG
jgi:hypothetical protein